MNRSLAICLPILLCAGLHQVQAQDASGSIQIKAPNNWRGETISLPPAFAPKMKLKGTEVIRFAPGMFEPDSKSFFSYVLVFKIEAEKPLTAEILQREFLVYYRGLAVAVTEGENVDFDPTDFSLKLEQVKPQNKSTGKATKKAAGKAQGKVLSKKSYRGDLKWLEPFATRKPQTLHLEVDVWQDGAKKHNYVFVCASPAKTTEPIWKQMRDIRRSSTGKRGNH